MTRGRKLAYALLVALFALLAIEGLCRVLAPTGGLLQGEPEQTQAGQEALMMHGNPFLLWELAPGDRVEVGGAVHVNADGFRDRKRGAKERPRVLALGDSSVYGFGVSDADLFTATLEREFDADFINGGIPGYSSTQALNLLWGRGLALDPDVLLVATLWSDNNFDRFVDSEQLDRYAAWQRTDTHSLEAVLEHSAVYRGLQFTLRRRAPGRVSWMQLQQASPSGHRRVPIGTYARNLAEFCTVMAERGGGVVFVILPNRHDMGDKQDDPPWVPYRTVMRDTARACGAPLVDLPKAFAQRGQPFLFLDEMHPSKPGHALMAEAIGQVLRGKGWPEQPIRTRGLDGAIAVPADTFEGRGNELELFGG